MLFRSFNNLQGELHTIEYAMEHANQCFEIAHPNSDCITTLDSSKVSPLKNELDQVKFAESRLVQIVQNNFDMYKNIFAFEIEERRVGKECRSRWSQDQ